jgi:cell division protein DivIC
LAKVEKKSANKVKKKVLRFAIFGVISFSFIIYFFSILFDMSMQISGKYKEKDELNNELNELKEREQELSTDVQKLQDPEYVARYLREKYYYSKSDELIIKLPNE